MKRLKRLWCRFFGHKKVGSFDRWHCARCGGVSAFDMVGWKLTYETRILNPLAKIGIWVGEDN